jgi:hypothetical protein
MKFTDAPHFHVTDGRILCGTAGIIDKFEGMLPLVVFY